MFVDELELLVRGGRGGNGAVSFRREKYVAKGGPDGGDGGGGGSVYLWADPGKNSFLDLRYRHIIKAEDGEHGKSKNRHGANGSDVLIPVPPGTLVRDEDGRLIADLVDSRDRALVARGGRGGKGNARFASSRRRVPRISEQGLSGDERRLFLELKLIAQVGLVGFPNAGKSTLLARVSDARPKIANYPFTTLAPNLGLVRVEDEGSFVVADLPGLIEGAHEGAGLGHRFLRHVERNLLLLLLLDLSPDAETEPFQAYRKLCEELNLFNVKLGSYPRVIALNKLDLPGSEERLERFLEDLEAYEGSAAPRCFAISAATGRGVSRLLSHLMRRVAVLQARCPEREQEPETVGLPAQQDQPLTVRKDGERFIVSGTAVEKMAARTDFENEEAVQRFQNYCRRSGLEKALRKHGVREGDTVSILSREFTYFD